VRFFIDEDLSPTLVRKCHEAGYDATCCRDRQMLGATDREVTELCMEEERILVTNNAGDFLKLAKGVGLHPGLVVMPLAGRGREQQWMAVAIEGIEEKAAAAEGQDPAASMVNQVVDVEGDACRHYEYP
jgi:predicted nuclease of predicted toxin-antitoxin system